MDDFIRTQEVEIYAEQGYGATTLVWQDHVLVGYYTVGRGEVEAESLRVGQKSFHTKRQFVEDNIPAVKIGRLAVDRRHQSKGIGRVLVAKIADDAINAASVPPVMVVRANPQSVDFYLKCGFVPFYGHPRKARSGSLSLFFRLDALHDPDIRAEVPI